MKTFHSFLFLFPIAFAFGQAETVPDLADYFAEDAALYMGVRNFPDMVAKYDRSPLRPFFESGGLGDWFANTDLDEEEQAELRDLFARLQEVTQGGAAFVLTDLTPFFNHLRERGPAAEVELPDDVLDPDAKPKGPALGDLPKGQRRQTERAFAKHVLLSLYTGSKQDAMHQWLLDVAGANDGEKQKVKVVERKIKEQEVFTARRHSKKGKAKGDPLCWGFAKGVAIIGPNAQSVASACKQIESGGPAKPLQAADGYRKAALQGEQSDGMLFLNLTPIFTVVDKELQKAELPEGSGLDADRISAALQLGAIEPATVLFRMEDDGLRLTMNYGFSEDTRLARVLMPHVDATAKRPDFIPADMISARSIRMSPRGLHDAVVDLANNINPQFGAVVPVMALQLKGMLGVDYRKHVLDNLGDSMVIAESFDPKKAEDEESPLQGSGYLIGMEMKDGAALLESLNKVRGEVGPATIAKRVIDGHTVYDIVPLKEEGIHAGFTMLEGYLLFCLGDVSLENVIATHKKPESSIWNSPRFKAMQEKLPEQAVSLGYTRVDSLFQQMERLAETIPGDVPADQMPDFEKLSELFGSALSASTKQGGWMTTDMMLYYQDKDAKQAP